VPINVPLRLMQPLERDHLKRNCYSALAFLFEPDLFGKPVSTFPDHALVQRAYGAGHEGRDMLAHAAHAAPGRLRRLGRGPMRGRALRGFGCGRMPMGGPRLGRLRRLLTSLLTLRLGVLGCRRPGVLPVGMSGGAMHRFRMLLAPLLRLATLLRLLVNWFVALAAG
jgi:hypothetical protein